MCHLTERKSKPQAIFLDTKQIQREEPISVAPATEALSLFCSKRKLNDINSPQLKVPPCKQSKTSQIKSIHEQLNQTDKTLIDAARSGDLNKLKQTLSDCDINSREPILGNSALHYAVVGNHIAIVQQLVQSPDIDIDIENRNGSTPLLSAVDYGHSAIVRILVTANADINFSDMQGFTAIHKAVLTGNLEILKFLLNKDSSSLNSTSTEQQLTPLHQAAFHGKKSAMKILLSNGAFVSPKSSNGTTPLHMAALKNQSKSIKYLIESGADVDMQDNHDRTPLHYSCLFGHLDAASELRKAKASLDKKDFKNQTPLELAARLGDYFVKVLFQP